MRMRSAGGKLGGARRHQLGSVSFALKKKKKKKKHKNTLYKTCRDFSICSLILSVPLLVEVNSLGFSNLTCPAS